VFVSDTNLAGRSFADIRNDDSVWRIQVPGQSPNVLELNLLATGRYVRVQLADKNVLSLAEVQVFEVIDPNADSDGDGVLNGQDAFPHNALETTDTDGDGVGDNGDAFPNDATESKDSDNDGVGDNADPSPFGEISTVNIAAGKVASQSSTRRGGLARRAVDGNADANYRGNSVTHTKRELNAWWQVDLGRSATVGRVQVLNRTDCCAKRLSNFYVFVSDTNLAGRSFADIRNDDSVWRIQVPGQSPNVLELNPLATGRYVRVQLAGKNVLSLAEVQAFEVLAPNPVAPPVGLLREWWTDIRGNAISDLTDHASFLDAPTGSEYITEFVGASKWAYSYGSRISGVFVGPTSGEYSFWVSGDDNVELWLSSDATQNHKALIANVPDWTSPQDWDRFSEQQSVAISLEAGEAYYIEALHKEGGSGDHVAVAWQLPGSTDIVVMGGEYFKSGQSVGGNL
jgi:hypothetical protein